jgi:L-aminopeptidase/D-esterase-like protein
MFRYNGAGELTGSQRLDETGVLVSLIVLLNSYAVGIAVARASTNTRQPGIPPSRLWCCDDIVRSPVLSGGANCLA